MSKTLQYVNSQMAPQFGPTVPPKLDNEYRAVVLGALNYENANGVNYIATKDVLGFFTESSRLMRQLRNRRLFFHDGHPPRKMGMTEIQYKNLLLQPHVDTILGHCRDIKLLDPTPEQLEIPGVTEDTIIIRGEVAPAGARADVLERSFNNPHEDTCFSIRSFVVPVVHQGKPARVITEILKWDKVPEPGMEVASSMHNPGLESLSDETIEVFSKEDLQAIKHFVEKDTDSVGVEARIEMMSHLLAAYDKSKDLQDEIKGTYAESALSRSNLFG